MAIEFSDGYNAQTIFEQVWEAPYEWFELADVHSWVLPCWVNEMGEFGDVVSTKLITVKDIEDAVLKHYMEIVSKRTGTWARNMADYLLDFDADDVDCILQWAMFDEIRYS